MYNSIYFIVNIDIYRDLKGWVEGFFTFCMLSNCCWIFYFLVPYMTLIVYSYFTALILNRWKVGCGKKWMQGIFARMYKCTTELLAQWQQQTIKYDEIHFDEKMLYVICWIRKL